MISNSIYHIVEEPNSIEYIIKVLFKDAKLEEIDDFISAYCDSKDISENAINDSKITLNEVKNFIDLRNVLKIDKKLIKQFIFHFSEKENEKIKEKLKLKLTTYEFNPIFDYDEDRKHSRIKLSEESSDEIIIDIYHPDLIEKEKGIKIFNSLKNQKNYILNMFNSCKKNSNYSGK